MRRIGSVLAIAALMSALLVATALPAFADQGGAPNEKACHGQVIHTLARLGAPPPFYAEFFDLANAGEFNKGVKEGEIPIHRAEVGLLHCPPS